jgi:hypothetical protein
MGEIFADKAFFYYSFDQGRLVPKRLELIGDVKIHNHASGSIQYALADRAEYQFRDNTLLLHSVERPRVLFYDTFNKVQASAPMLQVQRNPKTGHEAIQGHGDVHFLFAEEEWNELKNRFSLHEAT